MLNEEIDACGQIYQLSGEKLRDGKLKLSKLNSLNLHSLPNIFLGNKAVSGWNDVNGEDNFVDWHKKSVNFLSNTIVKRLERCSHQECAPKQNTRQKPNFNQQSAEPKETENPFECTKLKNILVIRVGFVMVDPNNNFDPEIIPFDIPRYFLSGWDVPDNKFVDYLQKETLNVDEMPPFTKDLLQKNEANMKTLQTKLETLKNSQKNSSEEAVAELSEGKFKKVSNKKLLETEARRLEKKLQPYMANPYAFSIVSHLQEHLIDVASCVCPGAKNGHNFELHRDNIKKNLKGYSIPEQEVKKAIEQRINSFPSPYSKGNKEQFAQDPHFRILDSEQGLFAYLLKDDSELSDWIKTDFERSGTLKKIKQSDFNLAGIILNISSRYHTCLDCSLFYDVHSKAKRIETAFINAINKEASCSIPFHIFISSSINPKSLSCYDHNDCNGSSPKNDEVYDHRFDEEKIFTMYKCKTLKEQR